MSVLERVTLDLGPDSYEIVIGEGVMTEMSSYASLIRGRDILVVTNDTIEPLYMKAVVESLTQYRVDTLSLPDGEQFKTLETLEKIITHLLSNGHKRSTTLVALGGGVVGDTTGFAAACYQRGVDFIQVPTTLLAQVDSSVGGKTAVNHPLGKNMIGAFHQPRGVIIDTETLSTLPDREFAAGMAEVIKHGALADRDYFAMLENNIDLIMQRDPAIMAKVIRRSCEIKAGIVAQDERESGVRALLNLGHTFGHAIETAMGYGNWLHGEAVGVGMVMAADLSVRMDMMSSTDAVRLRELVRQAGLPVEPPDGLQNQFPGLMARDKKATEDGLRFILLGALGNAEIVDGVPDELLLQTINAGESLLETGG
jgi:3-dehydroquinate synthase